MMMSSMQPITASKAVSAAEELQGEKYCNHFKVDFKWYDSNSSKNWYYIIIQ